MLEIDEKETIEEFLCLIADLGQQKENLMIESSNKTIGSCEFKVNKLNEFIGCIEDNPSFGVVSGKAKVCLSRHNDNKNVKYEDLALEEADREILLLENLLKESELKYELEPQVRNLCFNSFDEEMKYFEECIRKYESVEDSIRVFPSSGKGKEKLWQQKGWVKSLVNEGSKHKQDVVERDIFQDIQDITVEATSKAMSTEISIVMYGSTLVQEGDIKANGELQKKVWKPGAAKEDNQMYGQ